MLVVKEMSFDEFIFWGGAEDTVSELTDSEIETIWNCIEDYSCNDKPLTETQINDFFWFERDVIADWLGYESFEDIMKRNRR